ncbi:hypothetical protein LX36DRAFT_446540 [Colletotrichum falcatum]|nr:hypothetical protein LX36DRAFT_446540 [Colletotrichum falcatum]
MFEYMTRERVATSVVQMQMQQIGVNERQSGRMGVRKEDLRYIGFTCLLVCSVVCYYCCAPLRCQTSLAASFEALAPSARGHPRVCLTMDLAKRLRSVMQYKRNPDLILTLVVVGGIGAQDKRWIAVLPYSIAAPPLPPPGEKEPKKEERKKSEANLMHAAVPCTVRGAYRQPREEVE